MSAFAQMQQDFDFGAAFAALAMAEEPRRDDARVIDNQQIARPQKARQIADHAVVERRLCLRLDDSMREEFARHGGAQRDALRRQIKIEEIDAH